jgi:hypothetical protein
VGAAHRCPRAAAANDADAHDHHADQHTVADRNDFAVRNTGGADHSWFAAAAHNDDRADDRARSWLAAAVVNLSAAVALTGPMRNHRYTGEP